jgi:hypothetical protein
LTARSAATVTSSKPAWRADAAMILMSFAGFASRLVFA